MSEPGREETRPRAGFWLGSAVVVATLAAVMPGVLRGETFALRDLKNFHWPLRRCFVELFSLSTGLPDWNPFFANGQPFAANPQYRVFHPLSHAYLWVPFELAFTLEVVLPLLVSALGMAHLALSLGRSRQAAILSAVGWSASGYLLSTTNLVPILVTSAPVPFVLAALARLARRSSSRDVVICAASFALCAVGGAPSTILMVGALVPAVLASCRVSDSRGELLRAYGLAAAGLGLGALMASVSLLPGALLATKTSRAVAGGLDVSHAREWSLPVERLMEFTSPDVHGDVGEDEVQSGGYRGGDLYPDRDWPFLIGLYPGLLVTCLFLTGVVREPRRHLPWLITMGGGLFLTLGRESPLWLVLREFPPLGGLRYPERFALLICLPMVLVAADVFDRLAESAFLVSFRRVAAAVGLTAFSALAIDSIEFPEIAPEIVKDGLVAAGWAAALICASAWKSSQRGLLLVLLLAVDLGLAGRRLVPTVPVAELDTVPSFLSRIVDSDPWESRLFHSAALDNRHGALERRVTPPGPAAWGVAMVLESDFDLTKLAWSVSATEVTLELMRRRPDLAGALMARRGVTAVAEFDPSAPWARLDPPYRLLKPSRAGEFAFCAERVEEASDSAGWQEKMVELGPELSRTVVLEERLDLDSRPGRCEVKLVSREPDELRFEVKATDRALLAINQSWDESWRAWVDEAEVPIHRADLALQAVVIEAGGQELVLKYEDRSIRLAAFLSALGWLLGLGLWVRARREQ